MSQKKIRNLFAVLMVFAISGTFPSFVMADEGKNESGQREKRGGWDRDRDRDKDRRDERREDRSDRKRDKGDHRSYFHEHGYTRLSIPRGHYPPPGECRIWYPDRPPGHQPPPGSCRQLRVQVPPGAWLIRHPEDDRGHVHVNVYDPGRPGIVIVGVFEINTGSFLRELR